MSSCILIGTNIAATSGSSQFGEQIVDIKTEDYRREYCALSDTVLDGEAP